LTVTISRATTGFNAIPMPKFYIKTMVELEDHLTENLQKDKTNKKKSSGNTKAMNNLKQKLRKLAKQFEESITAYRKVKKKLDIMS
jgi:translation initiation factor 3 subunit C